MSTFFLLVALILAVCAATVLMSGAFLWYDATNRQPGPMGGQFATNRLLFAARLLLSETFCLFVTVLLRPLAWMQDKEVRPLVSRPPVLLLHGLFHNRGCWWWFARQLRSRGLQVYTVNLHLWHTPEKGVGIVAVKIRELIERGAPAVDLVGHSMGGLVARQYLIAHGPAGIRRCIFLGVPNHGSRLAPLALSPTGRMLLPGSPYLQRLNATPLPQEVRCTAIFSRHDNLVIPWESGRVEGARNIELTGIGHSALLYHPATINKVFKELTEEADENT